MIHVQSGPNSATSNSPKWHMHHWTLSVLQDTQGLHSFEHDFSWNLPTLRNQFQPASHTILYLAGAARVVRYSEDLGEQQRL